MSQLKQILHNLYMKSSSIISIITKEFDSLLAVRQSSPFQASLSILLLSLTLLISIPVLLVAISTLSLLWLMKMMLMKLLGLFSDTGMPGYNVRSILCQWADAVKNIPLMWKKSQTSAWNEDGDSPQDYTFHSSEMPGELKENEQLRRAMEAPIDYEKLRRQL